MQDLLKRGPRPTLSFCLLPEVGSTKVQLHGRCGSVAGVWKPHKGGEGSEGKVEEVR